MSFLNELKSQAQAVQARQSVQQRDAAAHVVVTENASKTLWHYITDLAQQLNVLQPDGPKLTLDGKTPWPAMKLVDFRVDSRKKLLNGKEVTDYIAMGWEIVPRLGVAVGGAVTVNFPPDLERVEKRLAQGNVQHERKEQRHPEKNTLLAIRFEYLTQSRGSLRVNADQEQGLLHFRLSNVDGFGLHQTSYPAAQISPGLLDELAKLLVGQPSRFV